MSEKKYVTQKIHGAVTQGSGTSDHNRLVNKDKENQHPISAITGLQEALDEKLNSETALPLIQKALSSKACGLYYDAKRELARKAYWYVCSEIDPVTKMGTKESVISGPYDLGMGGGSGSGSGGGVTNIIIRQINWPSAIAVGAKAELSIEWSSTIGEEKEPTGNGTLYVSVNSKQVIIRPNIEQGTVTFDVTKYLVAGNNTVQVNILDAYGTTGIKVSTITAVTLELQSNFDATIPYTNKVNYTYIPFGDVEKTVYFSIDGDSVGTQIVTASNVQQSYYLTGLSHGSHKLEVYFTALVDGIEMSSNTLTYDIIFYDQNNPTPIIASNFNLTQAEQYTSFKIPYVVYYPGSSTNIPVTLTKAGEAPKTVRVGAGLQYWEIRESNIGTCTYTISCGSANKLFTVNIVKSSITVNPETAGLVLDLNTRLANGASRTNTDDLSVRSTWTDSASNIECQLTNFNWDSNGWVLDTDDPDQISTASTVLRLSGKAKVEIPYKVFENDAKTSGKTIELDIATRNIRNYDTIIISCIDGAITSDLTKGFYVTPQAAVLRSKQARISTQYKEDDRVHITFVIEKSSENRNQPIIWMYINGIASGATQYTTTDSFDQAHPVGITLGSEEATLDIYSIRIYDIALNGQQVVNNWIANTSDPVLKAERYYRNDNFDDTGHISLNKLPSTTPYIIWDLPELPTAKGDKKSGNAEYTDPTDSSRNFTAIGAQYDVQGTSSAKYPVKNIRFRPEKGAEWFDDEGNDLKAKGVGFPITYPGGIGVGYFTFKVDYASSEGANNVELVRLYNDVSKKYGILTPPQYADMKATGETDTAIRVGIDGFPVVAFHRDASGKETFCTKANFNNDKNNPDVFGFAAGDESWEITNNTSGLSRFKVSVNEENFKTDDGQDFEIRYPNIDDYSDITLLKPMTEWVVSTNTETATNEPFSSPKTLVYTNVVQAEDLSFNTKTVTETFEADTAEYRLAKFKAELADHFNVNSTLFYYLFTEMFLMVDSRAKNAFPTYFKSRVAGDGGNRWFWLPYDMDTAIGINNEGELAFSYDKEDIDTINGDPDGPEVYNGQDSVMWKNVRAAYMGELTKMYQELRSQGLFSFENIEKMFEDHQGKWSENIFNEDAKLKYVAPLINTGNDYLGMLQGAKAEQRRWWLYNRFRYLDSKYNAASAVDEQNTIQFRAFVQDTSNTPDITIIPYADIYAAVSYKNNNLAQIRAHRGQEAILPSPKGEGAKMSDQEVYIYSASQLASIGDLSRFYPGYAQIGYATRLQSLKIGDASFNNPNFKRLTATNNPLLKTIDARRCVAWGIMDTSSTIDNQQRAVDLRACTGLEELYLDGTALIGVDLADGSNIRICHFPSTLTSLRLKNQLFLEELQFNKLEGDSLVSEDLDVVFSNLTEVWLENLKPQLLNVRRLVADMPNEAKLCLIGINETFDTYTSLVTFYNNLDRLSGLDANGNRTDIKRTISGTINLTEAISYARYIELKSRYPSLDINARVICTVRFYNNEELIEGPDAVQTVRMGDSVRDPGPQEKPATFAKTFVFTGWDASLDNIQEDLNINAVYRADDKSYTVTYDVRSAVATLETYSYTKTYDEWAETPVPNPTPAETDERVTFDGWYLADGTPWIFSTDRVSAFHRDITLYAHWSDPDKPEISSFERENCFKVRAEASDEFGIIAYGFSTAADVEPEDWISISPAVVNFDQLFDVKGISGQQYFWIKDTMNTVVSSNPVTTRLFTRQIAPGATLILKENNVVVESDSEAVIGTPHLDIIVELDPHYENLQVSFNGEPIGSTASIDIDTDSSLVITCDPMNYEVTFDAGINGEEVDTQIIEYNNLIKTPFKNQFQYTENATDGFIIDSWCLEDGTPWDFATDKVTENMTLYAHWVEHNNAATILTINIPEDDPGWVELDNIRSYPIKLNINQRDSWAVSVDWGDGLGYEPASDRLEDVELAHDYSAPGDYQIKIQKQVGKSYILGKNNNNQAAPTAVIMPSARLTNISLSWDITSVNNFAFANTSIASLQLTPYITSIANGMFKDCKNLTSIELPEYIETIGQSAFEGCSYLAGIITIPERTNTIGNNAFKACTSLSGINLNSRVSAIPNQFCAWCNALSEVNIPADSHITTVGGSAFFSCLALQSIELPASVRVLGMTVFGLCSSLSTIVLNSPELTSIASTNETINGGIVTPGSGTFTDIVGLRKVGTLDDADANLKLALTTAVPDNMFRGVTSIKVVHLPDTITSIGEFAFASNTNLETIILPSALETINDNAFYNTPKLMSINLDNTPHLQTIGRYAFAQAAGSTNSGLRSIKIPYSVQTIREFAFSSCRQLSEVEIYTPSFEPKVSDTDHLIFHWCSNLTVLKIPQEVGLEGAVAAYGEYFNYTASAQSVTPIADLPL